MVEQAKQRWNAIYKNSLTEKSENIVAQMAFTQLNSFLLTTDGRVFSWGGNTPCLGRQLYVKSEISKQESDLLGGLKLMNDGDDFQLGEVQVDEINFK